MIRMILIKVAVGAAIERAREIIVLLEEAVDLIKDKEEEGDYEEEEEGDYGG